MIVQGIVFGISFFNILVGVIFFVLYFYQFVYVIIPFVKKRKPHKREVIHNIGILISARNEEAVIGHLIDSIEAQDYPKGKLRIFVVADNCTDKTADICRGRGAIVYERFNRERIGKGYALDFLITNIDKGMDDYKLKKKFFNPEETEDMSQEKDSSKINDTKDKIKIFNPFSSQFNKLNKMFGELHLYKTKLY